MKLNESQAESFELLYCSLRNAAIYAEDMKLSGNQYMKDFFHQILVRLKYCINRIESHLPEDKRIAADKRDHLFIDELLRCTTHMDDDRKKRLEEFVNSL